MRRSTRMFKYFTAREMGPWFWTQGRTRLKNILQTVDDQSLSGAALLCAEASCW